MGWGDRDIHSLLIAFGVSGMWNIRSRVFGFREKCHCSFTQNESLESRRKEYVVIFISFKPLFSTTCFVMAFYTSVIINAIQRRSPLRQCSSSTSEQTKLSNTAEKCTH